MLIAGPCSAESEEQVLAAARALQGISCVRAFRSGIWKPRTRPSAFEGVGSKGLSWLVKAREETGLKLCVEVAQASHVKQCLEAGIDMVWIGARTTGNPFSVQEIADALAGSDMPVLVKNPLTPDVKLWAGALERLYTAGIRRIAAVHRGFMMHGQNHYRYPPVWEIPIELKRLYPNLQMFCDPSHIAGERDKIQSISQRALDMGMEGLMIEVHPDPSSALTDAAQQLTPAAFTEMLGKLEFLQEKNPADSPQKLKQLRDKIDLLDHEMLQLLAERMRIVEEMGAWKREHEVTILQLERWREIISDRLSRGGNLHLSDEYILRLFQVIHQASIRRQTEIYDKGRSDSTTTSSS